MNKSTLFQQVCSAVFSGISPRCFPSFLTVWGGQTERETPLCNIKLHAVRFGVCVGLVEMIEMAVANRKMLQMAQHNNIEFKKKREKLLKKNAEIKEKMEKDEFENVLVELTKEK